MIARDGRSVVRIAWDSDHGSGKMLGITGLHRLTEDQQITVSQLREQRAREQQPEVVHRRVAGETTVQVRQWRARR